MNIDLFYMIKKSLFLFLFFSSQIFAQQNFKVIPRDTSYAMYSIVEKMHKKFPDAKFVLPKLPSNVTEEKNIVYSEIGNRKLGLDIFYPKNSNKKIFPSVVLIHGGAWRSGDRSLLIPMAQKLASKGFVTAAIEYRLSIEALYPAAIYDIKSSIRWLRANAEKYNIDTNKIAIYGASAGGHIAALIGTTNGDKKFEGNEKNLNHSSNVQAIVDIDGVVDFFGKGTEELYKKSGKPSAAHLWFGASPKENPKVWKEASPINHTDKQTPSILFINSSQARFHAGRDEMIKILKKYNIYNEVHTLDKTIHTFWLFEPWFDKTLDYTIKFLNKALRNN